MHFAPLTKTSEPRTPWGLRYRLRASEQAKCPRVDLGQRRARVVFLKFTLETVFSSNCTKVPYGLAAALGRAILLNHANAAPREMENHLQDAGTEAHEREGLTPGRQCTPPQSLEAGCLLSQSQVLCTALS